MAPKRISKQAKALYSWQEGMENLGNTIAHFQLIENSLSSSISALTGRDKKLGMIISSELSFRGKISVFIALLLYRLDVEELPDDFIDLIKRIHAAEERRNTIVHSSWDACEKQPTMIVRKKKVCRRKGLTIIEDYVDPAALEEDVNKFEGIVTDIYCTMDDWLPKYSSRMPRK